MSQTLWIGEERGSLWVDVPTAAGTLRERASRIARRARRGAGGSGVTADAASAHGDTGPRGGEQAPGERHD